jgi:hypothetical protein
MKTMTTALVFTTPTKAEKQDFGLFKYRAKSKMFQESVPFTPHLKLKH